MANYSTAHGDRQRYRRDSATGQTQRVSERMPANKPSRNIVMKKNTPKRGSAPKVLFGAACVLVMLCAVIYGRVQRDQLFNDVAAATAKMDRLESEKNRMQVEIEANMSMKNVEEYAENELKLEKLDKSQIEYVKIQTGDVVEISDNDKNIFVRIKDAFNDFMEYIFD